MGSGVGGDEGGKVKSQVQIGSLFMELHNKGIRFHIGGSARKITVEQAKKLHQYLGVFIGLLEEGE